MIAVARKDQMARSKHGVRSVHAKVCGQHSIPGQNPMKTVPKMDTYRLIGTAKANTNHWVCIALFMKAILGLPSHPVDIHLAWSWRFLGPAVTRRRLRSVLVGYSSLIPKTVLATSRRLIIGWDRKLRAIA